MKKIYYKLFGIIIVIILFTNVSTSKPYFDYKDKSFLIKNQNNSFNENFVDLYFKLILRFCYLPSISVCVIRDSEILFSKGYGYSDPEIDKEANKETIYLVMSISKPIAATALMQLYEKGYFKLDDDVNDWLPFSLRNPNYPDEPITIRMLLSHQSSLAPDEEGVMLEYLSKTQFIGDPDLSTYPYPWLKDYLTPDGSYYTPHVWMDETPGTNFHYANVGYGLIGYLVELISGEDFNEYCKDNIFEPLQMYNTSFLYEDLNNSNISIPYKTVKKKFIPPLKRLPLYSFLFTPCCNLKTSVTDLSHFVMAHMNGGTWDNVTILNQTTVDLMHTNQYEKNNGEKYGLGFMIFKDKYGKKLYGHDGGGPGVHTRMVICPSDNTSFIYFSSAWPWRLTILIPLIQNFLLRKAKNL